MRNVGAVLATVRPNTCRSGMGRSGMRRNGMGRVYIACVDLLEVYTPAVLHLCAMRAMYGRSWQHLERQLEAH